VFCLSLSAGGGMSAAAGCDGLSVAVGMLSACCRSGMAGAGQVRGMGGGIFPLRHFYILIALNFVYLVIL